MGNEVNSRLLWRIFGLTVLLILIGTFGFAHLSDLDYGESFYSTLIIILTHYDHHGFTEPLARALVVFLDIASLGILGYLLKWFAEYMIGITDNVKKLRMKKKIDGLKNHYIVCGLGRVGSQVARELKIEGVHFVGLDRDKERVDEAIALGYLAINADSTDEDILKEAGITQANGLVACLGEDSNNLFVTLAARSLNPELYIVARANRQDNEIKLKRAGADRVALPYQIGGYHMASMALRPNVVDYMDVVTSDSGQSGLQVEEMVVDEGSKMAGHQLGQSLTDSNITGATVIAINGADGANKIRPTGKEVIYPGDRLIILGNKQDLNAASALIR